MAEWFEIVGRYEVVCNLQNEQILHIRRFKCEKKARYIKGLSKQSVPKKGCDKWSACFDKKIIRLGKGNRKYLGFD